MVNSAHTNTTESDNTNAKQIQITHTTQTAKTTQTEQIEQETNTGTITSITIVYNQNNHDIGRMKPVSITLGNTIESKGDYTQSKLDTCTNSKIGQSQINITQKTSVVSGSANRNADYSANSKEMNIIFNDLYIDGERGS